MTAPPAMVLASASPRRREILGRLGLPFTVLPAEVDEQPQPGESPEGVAARVALAKAQDVAASQDVAIVVGADTVVALDGAILDKPKDREEACNTLRRLRGRSHYVITAIALVNRQNGRVHTAAVTSKVWMRRYSEREIEEYVASGDPFDKAGAYAIQSPLFRPVARLEGCYNNVVGLPLCEVVRGLVAVGFPSQALPLARLTDLCPHKGR